MTTSAPANRNLRAEVIEEASKLTTIINISGSGIQAGLASLTASLTVDGSPVTNEIIAFTLDNDRTIASVGTVQTNANGVATLGGVSLADFIGGTYYGVVG